MEKHEEECKLYPIITQDLDRYEAPASTSLQQPDSSLSCGWGAEDEHILLQSVSDFIRDCGPEAQIPWEHLAPAFPGHLPAELEVRWNALKGSHVPGSKSARVREAQDSDQEVAPSVGQEQERDEEESDSPTIGYRAMLKDSELANNSPAVESYSDSSSDEEGLVIKKPWEWSLLEDQRLMTLRSTNGPDGEPMAWSEIAKHFPGRTTRAIQQHWGLTLRPMANRLSGSQRDSSPISPELHAPPHKIPVKKAKDIKPNYSQRRNEREIDSETSDDVEYDPDVSDYEDSDYKQSRSSQKRNKRTDRDNDRWNGRGRVTKDGAKPKRRWSTKEIQKLQRLGAKPGISWKKIARKLERSIPSVKKQWSRQTGIDVSESSKLVSKALTRAPTPQPLLKPKVTLAAPSRADSDMEIENSDSEDEGSTMSTSLTIPSVPPSAAALSEHLAAPIMEESDETGLFGIEKSLQTLSKETREKVTAKREEVFAGLDGAIAALQRVRKMIETL
ncbi:hypothetical protein T439DRAFT_325219 [Meredithblackwellia eburnea MCA 4105]